MKDRIKTRIALIVWLATAAAVQAQSPDTLRHGTLQTVEITSQRPPSATASDAPTQVAAVEKIEHTGATQVADVLQQMAGVSIKDYGGVGGIKTVSARGLGSQFSTLTLDGVAVSDFQNGQIDLGRYLVGNAAWVGLAHGQQDDLLQTARAFAAGSVINMETARPRNTQTLKMALEGGSFGYMAPTLLVERRCSKRMALSIWGNYTKSDGDYPFTQYYTLSRGDSSSRETRRNSEMSMGTVDANIFYDFSPRSSLTAKVHLNKAHHNLPGPAVLYNIKASEHTDDAAWLAQAKWLWHPTERLRWQLAGKAYGSSCIYEDTAANGASQLLHNEYHQQEYYGSSSVEYALTDHWKASMAVDGARSRLLTNLDHDNNVARWWWTAVAATAYNRNRIKGSANLLATAVADYDSDGKAKSRYSRMSPYASASWLVADLHDSTFSRSHRIRLRYFFKENYRVPTFNELYYFAMQRDLRPEKALQHNVGLTYYGHQPLPGASLLTLSATVDAYYNNVADKLVAIPTQNLFLWSMSNLGRVEIKGLDLNVQGSWECGLHSLSLSGNYSWQQALDMTNPTDKTYGNQIAYTPRHSGGATLYWNNPWVNVGYTLVAVGQRYRLGQNTPDNLVEGYCDHGLILSRNWETRHGNIALQAQVLNLADVQYEVVKSYPMMGRNYRLKLTYDITKR